MRALESTKLGLDIAAELSDATADCFDSLAGMSSAEDIVLSGGAVIGLTIASCAGRYAGASFRSGAAAVELQMTQAERSHDLAMQMTEAETTFQVCMNDAEMELVEEGAATERVTAALLQTEAAAYRIDELQIAARTLYEDGRGALAAARNRYVRPLTHDFWLDAQVERFWRDLRLARRVTYLAVRAVEYETQQSLPYRTTVLRARLPDELWGVLTDLWTMTGTRSIGGNRPTDLKVVLSLRSSLLQLADRSDFADGEHAMSDAERFRALLTAPRHAVYGNDGRYLGQRIPFTLQPLGSIGRGDAQGIPVLAGSDCAERLWSVNASVLGEGLYRGDAPTFTRVDLLKSNTFASQWCAAPGADEPALQIAAVRPSRNLFRDPEHGTTMGVGGPLGLANEATLESRARIEAYFNVDRATFESDEYANGATSELAARGLYGDYALFIPADVIARDGSDGLVLENVDDILLRLDYVSVAR